MRHRKEASNKKIPGKKFFIKKAADNHAAREKAAGSKATNNASTDSASWTQKTVLKIALVFIVSFFVYVAIWVQVKNAYAEALTYFVSKVATVVKNVNFDYMDARSEEIEVVFSDKSHTQWSLILSNDEYTYNAPLTFAIITCFIFCISNKLKVFIYSLLLLAGIHVLFIFSREILYISVSLMANGAEPVSKFYISLYTFFHYFLNNFIIRFEPFLLGFYIYIYNFKKVSPAAV